MSDADLLELEAAARFGTREDGELWTRALLRHGQAFGSCVRCYGRGWLETPKRGRFRCESCASGEPETDPVPLGPVDRYGRGGRTDPGSWRDRARPIIGGVLRATHGRPEAEIRAALLAAYPFGRRAHHPYKVWLDEIRRQRGIVVGRRSPVLQSGAVPSLFPEVDR